MRTFGDFKDKNGRIIEEGDVIELIDDDDKYNLLRVHWDWRRSEPGVLSFFDLDKKSYRSRYLAEVESRCQILCKHDSDALLVKISWPQKYFSSGGVPFVPMLTQAQAQQLGDFYDHFPTNMSDRKRKLTAQKILFQLGN